MKYSFRDKLWETMAKDFPKGLEMPIQLNIYDGKEGEEILVGVYKLENNLLSDLLEDK